MFTWRYSTTLSAFCAIYDRDSFKLVLWFLKWLLTFSLQVCDLSSVSEIKSFTSRFSSKDVPLHILVKLFSFLTYYFLVEKCFISPILETGHFQWSILKSGEPFWDLFLHTTRTYKYIHVFVCVLCRCRLTRVLSDNFT